MVIDLQRTEQRISGLFADVLLLPSIPVRKLRRIGRHPLALRQFGRFGHQGRGQILWNLKRRPAAKWRRQFGRAYSGLFVSVYFRRSCQHLTQANMPANIVATSLQITSAINAFPTHYHLAFNQTIALSRQYLRSAVPPPALVSALALQLRQTLIEYGAGTREAPTCRSLVAMQNTLADSVVIDTLRAVARLARSLRLSGESRSIANGMDVALFESQMLTALKELSTGLFTNCPNVTYPMKALMLLTGAIPAFDSQVKKGLSLGGFAGFAATQYLLDTAPKSAAHMKLTRLPFLLGDCCWRHRALLSEAAANSTQPRLFRYPGRLFDVLLFVQGRNGHPLIVELTGGAQKWHRLN